jgi:hypothetical protein
VAVSAVALEPHHSATSSLGGIIVPAHRAARRTRRFHVAALGGLTLLAAVGPGAGAALAAGADVKNCDDFRYQEDAQAVYDEDTTDPNKLDGNDDDGRACESLPSREAITDVSLEDDDAPADPATSTRHSSTGTTWTAADTSHESSSSTRDRDCADFDSQAEAQAVLDDDPSDPERLDADDDGIACEDHFGEAGQQVQVHPTGGVDTGGA